MDSATRDILIIIGVAVVILLGVILFGGPDY